MAVEEAGEDSCNDAVGSARHAVIAFDRDAKALFRDGGAEDALGFVQVRPVPAT